jgi:hypothetical protein
VVGDDGEVLTFGNAGSYGSLADDDLQFPIVGIAPTHDGGGYWLVDQAGHVWPFGDAASDGSVTSLHNPVVGIAADPLGGYYVVDSGGCVYPFGGAQYWGSVCGSPLNTPIVAVATRAAGGYWMVASDGGIFAFGAPFEGSTGGMPIDSPITGIAAASDGGYWLTTEDGTVYPFGGATGPFPTAHDFGGLPVSGIAANPAGIGYWLVDLNADVQATGDASTYPETG